MVIAKKDCIDDRADNQGAITFHWPYMTVAGWQDCYLRVVS